MNIEQEIKKLWDYIKCTDDTLDKYGLGQIINTISGHRIGTYVNRIGQETDFYETITTFQEISKGIIRYTSEDGEYTDIDTRHSNIIDNEDGTSTITTDDGNSVTVYTQVDGGSAVSVVTVPIMSGHEIATHYDGINTTVSIQETVTTLIVDNSNIVYTDENGDFTSIDIGDLETVTYIVNNNNGTYSYFNEDNDEFIIDIEGNETITILQDFGNGIFSYTNEAGNIVTIDTRHSTIVNNGDGTSTITTDDGNSVIVNNADESGEGSVSVISNTITGNRIATHYDGLSITKDINETITKIDEIVPGHVIGKYHRENGSEDLLRETVTTITENLSVGNLIGNYHNENGDITPIYETNTKVVDNGDGTFTYTSEDGTNVTTWSDGSEGAVSQISEVISYQEKHKIFKHFSGVTGTAPVELFETVTSFDDKLTGTANNSNNGLGFKHLISQYKNENFYPNANNNDLINIYESVTTIQDGIRADGTNETGWFTYTNESGNKVEIHYFDAANSGDLSIMNSIVTSGNPIADHRPGDGLNPLTTIYETITQYSNSVPSGRQHLIGVYDNEDTAQNSEVDVFETSTSIVDKTNTLSEISYNNNLDDKVLISEYRQENWDGDTNSSTSNSYKIYERVTKLEDDNVNGQFTYTNEAGNQITVTYNSNSNKPIISDVLSSNIHKIFHWNDGWGTEFDVFETLTTITDETGLSEVFYSGSNLTDKVLIAKYEAENYDNTNAINIYERVTKIVQGLNSNEFIYYDEAGNSTTITIEGAGATASITQTVAGHKIFHWNNGVDEDFDVFETISTLTDDGNGNYTYTNENGDTTTFNINGNETITNYVDSVTGTSHKIGTYTNESNVSQDVFETVSTLVDDSNNNQFTYTDEAGNSVTVNYDSNAVTHDSVIEDLGYNTNGNYGYSNVAIANGVTLHRIFTHKPYDDVNATATEIYQTVTVLEPGGNDGEVKYTDELGVLHTITIPGSTCNSNLTSVNSGKVIANYTDCDGNTTTNIEETITTVIDLLQNVSQNENPNSNNNKHIIAQYHPEDYNGTSDNIYETVTRIVDNYPDNDHFAYYDELGWETVISKTGSGSGGHDSGIGQLAYANDPDGNPMPSRSLFQHTPDDQSSNWTTINETATRIENYDFSINGTTYTGKRYINEQGNSYNITGDGEGVTIYSDQVLADRKHKIGELENSIGVIYDVNDTITVIEDNKKLDGSNQPTIADNNYFCYRNENDTWVEVNKNSGDVATGYNNDLTNYFTQIGYLETSNGNDSVYESVSHIRPLFNSETYTQGYGAMQTLGITPDNVFRGDSSDYTFGVDLPSTFSLDFIGIGEFYNENTVHLNNSNVVNGDTEPLYQTVTRIYDEKRADGTTDTNYFTYLNEKGELVEIQKGNTSTGATASITDEITGHKIFHWNNGSTTNPEDKDIFETVTNLSISGPYGDSLLSETSFPAGGPYNITKTLLGNYHSEDGNSAPFYQSVTKIVSTATGFEYYDEVNAKTTVDLSNLSHDSIISQNNNANLSPRLVAIHRPYVGGSPVDINESITEFINLNSTGNLIGTYYAEDYNGSTVGKYDIKETNTNFTNLFQENSNPPSGLMTSSIGYYNNESGTTYDLHQTTTYLKELLTYETVSNGIYDQGYVNGDMDLHRIGIYFGEDLDDYTNETLNGTSGTNIYETITRLISDDDSNATQLTFKNERGEEHVINLATGGGTCSSMIDENTGQSQIATFTSCSGDVVHIHETNTTISRITSSNVFHYNDEQGNTVGIDVKEVLFSPGSNILYAPVVTGSNVGFYNNKFVHDTDEVYFVRNSYNSTVDMYLSGDLDVDGDITGSVKNFKITHPTDDTKYLYHSSVEGNERFTFYRGRITTDSNGDGIVVLPSYFEALNKDYEYQLTVIGSTFANAIISQEVVSGAFRIKTSSPNITVSWQVTGIRQDQYCIDHPFVEEELK